MSSASGKVILFGEHAVVHGVPAIAVGIDRGATATARFSKEPGPSTLEVGTWGIAVEDGDRETPLARAFGDLVAASGVRGRFVVEAETDLPPGAGLGCSAALGVAVARALDPDAENEVVVERAGVWERVFHGNPSGVDVAVATLGGCVEFVRGAPVERVRVPGVFHLCVGHSGQVSSTRSMVDAVARLRDRRPETTQNAFNAIATLVRNARLAIEAADRVAVGQLLDLNQMLLSGLFVSTPEIEQMCGLARGEGALGAKLTGAGGGGCVVALVDTPDVGAAVLTAWKRDGFDGFLTSFGHAERREVASAPLEGHP
jgi:mevalonate kinase